MIYAFLVCFILNQTYIYFNFLNESYSTFFTIEPLREGFVYWLQDQALNLLYVFVIVVIMVTVLELLKVLGVDRFLKKALIPVLRMFGISKEATNIIIVGMTIGLQFGGGILIKEVKSGKIDMNKEIVLFCAGGLRSALAAKSLKEMGFEKVSHIDGGFAAISQSDFKIV